MIVKKSEDFKKHSFNSLIINLVLQRVYYIKNIFIASQKKVIMSFIQFHYEKD